LPFINYYTEEVITMLDHPLEKKTEHILKQSASLTGKKVWQTPHLLEMDYSSTNAGGAGEDDGDEGLS
jgi:hypothetical protein